MLKSIKNDQETAKPPKQWLLGILCFINAKQQA
jgi:hypothetical protein